MSLFRKREDTVDSILSDFSKAVESLKARVELLGAKIDRRNEEARAAIAAGNDHVIERQRAHDVIVKLNDLLGV